MSMTSKENEPFVVILKDKSHDYKNNPKKKGDKILKQTYFKVVKRDNKTGKLKESSMEDSTMKDTIRELTKKFQDLSFSVAAYYENVGWISTPNDKFNGGSNPSLYQMLYGDIDDYGEITDLILYSYPKVTEVT